MGARTHSSATVEADPTISPAEVRRQLDRIVASDAFQRSLRLKDFLRYITELTLAGKQDDINEFLIGVEVFGRGSSYNPSEDSVVRRQAHSLRQKLDDYYSSGGAEDAILVEIPLGHYVPVFKRRPRNPGPERLSAAGSASANGWRSWAWGLAMTFALAFLAGRFTVDAPTAALSGEYRPASAVLALWSPWLAAERGAGDRFQQPLDRCRQALRHASAS